MERNFGQEFKEMIDANYSKHEQRRLAREGRRGVIENRKENS